MGSIPGPVIVFRISQPELAGAINPALQQIRSQAKTVSDGIAEDWKRMAAQIRASVAQDATDTRGLASSRQQLVTILDKEISGLKTRNELSRQELSNLKAATLERERQASFLKGSGGITAGTSNALNQVSTQTVLGVERMMDAIVNRVFGGAAGAAFRTVRDVGYYSSLSQRPNIAAGEGGASGGTGGGVFSGLTGGFAALTAKIPTSVLAIGGLGAALLAAGAATIAITKEMMDEAQAATNMAAATGLSTTQIQEYNELAKEMGLDTNTITQSFARLQSQIGEYVTKGKSADESTQAFVRVLTSQGIAIKNADGGIRDINDILGDFSDKLSGISDANTRTALTLEAFGTRGKIVAQIMNQAATEGKSFGAVLAEIGQSGTVFSSDQIQQLEKAKLKWDEWGRSVKGAFDQLKLGIAEFTISGDKLGIIGRLLSGNIGDATLELAGAGGSSGAPTDRGHAAALNFFAESAKQANQSLLDRAEAIKAGGAEQAKLVELEKQYADAVKDSHGADAIKYQTEIENLKAVIDLEEKRAAIRERIFSPTGIAGNWKTLTKAPITGDAYTLSSPSSRPFWFGPDNYVGPHGINQIDLPTLLGVRPANGFGVPTAPNVGGGFPGAPGGLGSLIAGLAGSGANTAPGASLIESLTKQAEDAQLAAIKDGVEKINIEYQRDLQNFRLMLQQKQISQEQFNEAVALEQQITNSRIEEVREKELDKYKQEAGSLFDALVSGQKNIGKKLQSAMEEIVLAPLKKGFDDVVARELQDLGDLFKPASQRTPSTSGGSTATGGVVARIYSKLGTIFGPLTPPTYGNNPAPPGGGGAGQSIVSTMRVQAGIVYVGGLGGVGGIGAGDGLLGSTGAQLLSSAGFSGSSGFGSIGSNPLTSDLPFTADALKTTNQFMGLNTTSPSAGGFNLTASNGLGLLTGGAGLFAALTSANQAGGGAGGAFKGLLGGGASGAELGATIGSIFPGLGTVLGAAIGGAFGGFAGLLSGVLGSDWSTNVTKAMNHQNYIAPGSENFSFASNGSIANTLQTGFNSNGGTFSQNKLAANTPFWANAITGYLTWQQKQQITQAGWGSNPNEPFNGNPQTNPFVGQGPVGYKAGTSPTNVSVNLNLPGYIDGQGAQAALGPHLDYIASAVSSKVSGSSSGFGFNARRAVNLP